MSKCFRWIFWHIYIHWIIAFQWFSLNRHQPVLTTRIRISRPQRFLLAKQLKQFQAVQRLMSTLLIVVNKINKISWTIITLRKKIWNKNEKKIMKKKWKWKFSSAELENRDKISKLVSFSNNSRSGVEVSFAFPRFRKVGICAISVGHQSQRVTFR